MGTPKKKVREYKGHIYYHIRGNWYDSETNMKILGDLASQINSYFAKKEKKQNNSRYERLKREYPLISEGWGHIPGEVAGGAPGLGKRK